MTPRERWRAAIMGKKPDRTPSDYWGTAETTARLLHETGCGDERELWLALHIDKCIYTGPRNTKTGEDTWHTPSHFGAWGVGTKMIPYGDGLGEYEEAVFSPLAGAESPKDIERYAWPEAGDWDLEPVRRARELWPDNPIVGGSFEPFYLYCRLRGMERALEDFVSDPAVIECALERIYAIHEGIIRRTLELCGGDIDLIYVAEDLGTQQSLLMSPALFRRFLKPWLTKMTGLAHSFGAYVFHHDDGAIRPLLPDLIEAGIDLLNPVQWRCRGMDREGLARDFGESIAFHGAVDNQQTLPFGSPDDVRREVEENIRVFRRARGYVVAPCHNIQANTPTANIMALYEAVVRAG